MVNEDREIDFIPLHEVSKVQEMFIDETKRDSTSVNAQSDRHKDNGETNLFDNAFQVATIPDGHNSGRRYYLKASSRHERQEYLKMLGDLAMDAARRAAGNTRIRLMQDTVRRFYMSKPFQYLAALLIVAVC